MLLEVDLPWDPRRLTLETEWESKALLKLHEEQLLFDDSLAPEAGLWLICWAYFILWFIIFGIHRILSFASMAQIRFDLEDDTLGKDVLNFILLFI